MSAPGPGALPAGTPVPEFVTRNQYGETVSSADLRGRPVLLVFYPWAFSGICSGELADLTGRAGQLAATGARVLAVSCDAMFTLRAFAEAADVPFELLTDHWPHGEIARAFGVFDDRAGAALRGSFVIDRDGIVRWGVLKGLGEARDMAGHLAALAGL